MKGKLIQIPGDKGGAWINPVHVTIVKPWHTDGTPGGDGTRCTVRVLGEYDSIRSTEPPSVVAKYINEVLSERNPSE